MLASSSAATRPRRRGMLPRIIEVIEVPSREDLHVESSDPPFREWLFARNALNGLDGLTRPSTPGLEGTSLRRVHWISYMSHALRPPSSLTQRP